jgi:DNA polymerase-3 subunit delta'
MSEVIDLTASLGEPLPWHRTALRAWFADRTRWPHAWLLHGPAGFGKRIFAMHVARSLLCEAPREGAACGECSSCHWFGQGQHPDFRLLEPRADEDDADKPDKAPPTVIKIEQVRALGEFLQLSAHRHGAKVALIHPAEAMNPAAANALLKTLEEPPAGSYLLLVSDQPRRLPATIRSRCRAVVAPRPSAEAAQAWLLAQGSGDPSLHLAQAGGSPLNALAGADAAWQAERRALLVALGRPRELSAVAIGAQIDAVPKPRRKQALELWCNWLLAWTHDLAAVAGGGEPRFNPDFRDVLARIAAGADSVGLHRYYRALLRERALLGHPLQPRLAAESLLLQYRQVMTGEASA